ncbi:MAG: GGDEF domain-containing protein [archaeon]
MRGRTGLGSRRLSSLSPSRRKNHLRQQSIMRNLKRQILKLTPEDIENKRKFFERVSKEIKKGKPSILMIDMDYLKEINDKFGHDAGTKAINLVKNSMQKVFGRNAVRWGGDEFLAFSRDTGTEIRSKLVELKRVFFESFKKEKSLSEIEPPSFSVGVVSKENALSYNSGEKVFGDIKILGNDSVFNKMIKIADAGALYSKSVGRNTSTFASKKVFGKERIGMPLRPTRAEGRLPPTERIRKIASNFRNPNKKSLQSVALSIANQAVRDKRVRKQMFGLLVGNFKSKREFMSFYVDLRMPNKPAQVKEILANLNSELNQITDAIEYNNTLHPNPRDPERIPITSFKKYIEFQKKKIRILSLLANHEERITGR